MIFADAFISYPPVGDPKPHLKITQQPFVFRLFSELVGTLEAPLRPVEGFIDRVIDKVETKLNVDDDHRHSIEWFHISTLSRFSEELGTKQLCDVDFPGTPEELAEMFNWNHDFASWNEEEDE